MAFGRRACGVHVIDFRSLAEQGTGALDHHHVPVQHTTADCAPNCKQHEVIAYILTTLAQTSRRDHSDALCPTPFGLVQCWGQKIATIATPKENTERQL